MPERSLRDALSELTGHFLPVTDATYWSDSLGEARTQAELLAVNHERAQILAPHRVSDPWAGLDSGQPRHLRHAARAHRLVTSPRVARG